MTHRARRRQVRRAFRGGWDPVRHNVENARAWRRYDHAALAFRIAVAQFRASALAASVETARRIDAGAKEMAASYHLEPNLDPIPTPKDTRP